MPPHMCGQGVDSHPRLLGGRLFAGMTVVEGGLTLTPALSRQGRGGKSPSALPLTLFSCVVGLRSPGWRAAGVRGVDGSCPGVRLVPVRLELFPDPALGDGELCGCGSFSSFSLLSMRPWRLRPGALCSGASCSGMLCVLPFGRAQGERGLASVLRSRRRLEVFGCVGCSGLRVERGLLGATAQGEPPPPPWVPPRIERGWLCA